MAAATTTSATGDAPAAEGGGAAAVSCAGSRALKIRANAAECLGMATSAQSHRYRNSASYGQGTVDLTGELDLVDGQALVARLNEVFASPGYAPPLLPTVAAEVMAAARAPELDPSKVCALLERDALLAAMALKVAQSPLYGGGARTLREAVVRLGARGVYDVVLEAALHARIFRAPGYDAVMARLRTHSVAVAHAARALCRYTSLDADHAFLCGLLHDVGIAVGIIAVADKPALFGKPSRDALAVGLGEVHEAASGVVAAAWQLGAEVRLVVSRHHHPIMDGFPHPMIELLSLAERVAAEAGHALDPPDASARFEVGDARAEAEARRHLSLDDKTWDVAHASALRALQGL